MPALRPEDCERLFAEALNRGDIEAIVELYEPDAKIRRRTGETACGHAEIREHVKDMLTGTDAQARPCLLLDPITARQFIDRGGFDTKQKLIRFIHETGEMPAGRYWDLQLVQNYIYTKATFGESPKAKYLNVPDDTPVRLFEVKDINVVVVGGEANGYWQMMGAHHKATVSVDEWR